MNVDIQSILKLRLSKLLREKIADNPDNIIDNPRNIIDNPQ